MNRDSIPTGPSAAKPASAEESASAYGATLTKVSLVVKPRLIFGQWWLRFDHPTTHKNARFEGPFPNHESCLTRHDQLLELQLGYIKEQ